MKKGVLLLALCVVAGCTGQSFMHTKKPVSQVQIEQHTMLLGTWYGETTTMDGKRMQQIIEHKPNGVFFVSFRTTAIDGSIHESKEVGAWGVAGGLLFTITTGWVVNGHIDVAKPGNPYLDDAYQLVDLTPTQLRDKHIGTGDEFTASKVSDGFKFPEDVAGSSGLRPHS